MLDTYTDVWNRVLLRCPVLSPKLSQDMVRNAFRRLAEMRRWSWLVKFGQFITPPVYSTGRVTVTQYSTIVTGVDTVWTAAMVGRQFRMGLAAPIYTIAQFVSATEIVLDSPWGGESDTNETYQIYQCFFPVPDDFHQFITLWDPAFNWQLYLNIQQAELNIWDAQRANVSNPYVVAFRDYTRSQVGIVSAVLQVNGDGPSPVSTGIYLGPANAIFTVECTLGGAVGTAEFQWKKNDGPYTTGVVTSEMPQDLMDGVQIYWPPVEVDEEDVEVSLLSIDDAQERMSAMNISLPFRGPLVDATEAGFSAGNRSAAAYMHGGSSVVPPPSDWTQQQRMAAMHLSLPFRGPMVDATDEGFTAANRSAAAFMYAGESVVPPPEGGYVAGDIWVIQCTAISNAGVPRYELWPHGQSNKVYPFLYEIRATDISDPRTVIPRYIRGDVLLEMVLAEVAMWPGPSNDQRNPYYSEKMAAVHLARSERMIQLLEVQDDEVWMQDLQYQYPSMSWEWATPLGDARFLQSHAI